MEVYADVLRETTMPEYNEETLEEVMRAVMGRHFGTPLSELPGHILAGILSDAGWRSCYHQLRAETDPDYHRPRWAAAVSVKLDIQSYVGWARIK